MMNVDQNALECDLAETYNIYDLKELPLKKVALFSAGLKDDSRIKIKMMGLKCDFRTMLFASILDRLALLSWQISGAKKDNRPDLLTEQLLNKENKKEKENKSIMAFNTSDEFEKARNILLKGGK